MNASTELPSRQALPPLRGAFRCVVPLGWLLIEPLLGCGASTSPRGAPASGAEEAALTWIACGPTDGPARALRLSDTPRTCAERTAIQSGVTLEVDLYRGDDADGAAWTTLEGSDGRLSRCVGRACDALPGGRVRLGRGADGVLRGTLEYVEGGATRTRSFRAEECVVHEVCG